jgi:hypothetical protein
MPPNPSGGRAARTHASGQLRCRRAHDSPLPGDLCHGLDTPRRTSRSVSRVSGSRLSSVQLSTREDGTCLSRALASATSERCEGNTSFTCVLTSWGGATVIRTGTHPDQLRLRAGGTNTPRSRLAGSALQYAPSRLHFHPLPCLAQTSRFVTRFSVPNRPSQCWSGDLLPLAQEAHDRGADVPRSARHPSSCRYSTLGGVNVVVNRSLRFRIVRPVMAE